MTAKLKRGFSNEAGLVVERNTRLIDLAEPCRPGQVWLRSLINN